ncbi:MAG: hypothetical protein WDO71_02845 [Bacteroidota bacterium]
MNTRLIVDSTNQLQELNEPGYSEKRAVRLVAKVISYIFHPIFIPVYILLFLLYIHPGVFAGFSGWKKSLVLVQAIAMYEFFPLVTVLLLKALKFIDSIYLVTRKDRIIPYIACNLWYFWIWYVWKNQADYPDEVITLALAIFISSVIGQLANIYMKISMHAIAMGVMAGFMMLMALTQSVSFGLYISVSLFIAGLVCSARFIVSDHSPKEVYAGLFAGIFALVISIWVN